jgi:maleate cis-trans isomerase
VKLGFLYPGNSAEDDIPWLVDQLFPDGEITADVVHTSVGEDLHTVDAVFDLGRADRLAEGGQQLAEDQAAVALWACTAGSFTYGLEGATTQAESLGEAFGGPASSTSLAFVGALRELGITKVAVAATYPQPVADAFESFLVEAGFEVTATAGNGIITAAEAGTVGKEAALDILASVNSDGAEAVVMPDTALHTVRWLEELAEKAGKPVLTANQVTVWEALRLIDRPTHASGHGALFAEPTPSA